MAGKIIGLTGKYASGKGEIASYLKSKDFDYFSFSAMMEKEVGQRGLPVTRQNTINIANEMRQKHGNAYWAKRIISKIGNGKNCIVESFRNPDEIREFKKLPSFRLMLVDAPLNVRYERALKRKRAEDSDFVSFEEFKKLEKLESKSRNKASQQLEECAKMADVKIVNDSTLGELHKKIGKAIGKIPGRGKK